MFGAPGGAPVWWSGSRVWSDPLHAARAGTETLSDGGFYKLEGLCGCSCQKSLTIWVLYKGP